MNWIKINPGDLIPCGNFLVTDGEEIAIQYRGLRECITPKIKNWTHYIMLDDIPMPDATKD